MIETSLVRMPREVRFVIRLVASAVLASLACAAAYADEGIGSADESRGDDPRVLSAYFGDSVLPAQANQLCAAPNNAPAEGFGGMPIVFRDQIDPVTLDPSAFRVKVSGQSAMVTPVCATLAPALGAAENRTVLLVGDFGLGGANRPVAIRIAGNVKTTGGASLKGLVTRRVDGTDVGPRLVLAENVAIGDSDCPAGETSVAVKLTFSGGPTGPNGAALDADAAALDIALAAIQVVGDVGGQRTVFTPFALGDANDGDNHVDACFNEFIQDPERVAVDSNVFFGPQNGANRAAAVPIN